MLRSLMFAVPRSQQDALSHAVAVRCLRPCIGRHGPQHKCTNPKQFVAVARRSKAGVDMVQVVRAVRSRTPRLDVSCGGPKKILMMGEGLGSFPGLR
jgi:hypothetical protein